MDYKLSVLNQAKAFRFERGNTKMPCLAVKYHPNAEAGEWPTTQKLGATIAISATGGGASQLRVILAEQTADEDGTAGTAVSHIFDGATGGAAVGVYEPTVCATLKDLVDGINALGRFQAYALNAPHFLSLASDAFETLSATDMRSDGQAYNCLYRTVSSGLTLYMRVGLPELSDKCMLNIMRFEGTSTGTSGTPLLRYFKDPIEDGIADGSEVAEWSYTRAAALTKYIDHESGKEESIQGPIIVEASGADLSALDMRMLVKQGSI